jgi:invasion protein IalB
MTTTPPPPPPAPGPRPLQPARQRSGCATVAIVAAVAAVGVLLLVAVTVAILAAAATSPATEDAVSPQPATTAVEHTEAPAGSSPTNPAPLGTPVSPAKDWTVTVTAGDRNANARMAALNQFNKPKPGTQFLTVTLEVRNNSDRPEHPPIEIGMLTPGGVRITESFLAEVNVFNKYAQLQPGGILKGELVYEVPVEDANAVVLLAEPMLTLDQVDDQRFLSVS